MVEYWKVQDDGTLEWNRKSIYSFRTSSFDIKYVKILPYFLSTQLLFYV